MKQKISFFGVLLFTGFRINSHNLFERDIFNLFSWEKIDGSNRRDNRLSTHALSNAFYFKQL